MNNNVIDFKVVTETKFQEFKRKAKEKMVRFKEWAVDHPDELIIYISLGVTAIGAISKTANKLIDQQEEKKLKDLYVYDRSMGRYIELRRPLRQKDLVSITNRRSDGEKLTDILLDMNLVR